MLDEITKEILEPIVHDFQTRYPRVEGEAYLGYPIYFNRVTNEKTSVDMALITKIGVFIFNVLKNTVPNYDEIQNDIYYRVKEKFQRLPHLRNGKKLKFEFFSITYSMEQITPIDDCPIAFSVEDGNLLPPISDKKNFLILTTTQFFLRFRKHTVLIIGLNE